VSLGPTKRTYRATLVLGTMADVCDPNAELQVGASNGFSRPLRVFDASHGKIHLTQSGIRGWGCEEG
jgi:hypothetical protein